MQIGKRFLAAFLVIIGSTAVMWFAWMVFLPKASCESPGLSIVPNMSASERAKYLDSAREVCLNNGGSLNH